jgi:protein TonB
MAAGAARATTWNGGSRHALEYAIAASLALHALALGYLPAPPSGRAIAASPPLEARLEPVPPVTAPEAPPPPPRVAETKPSPPEVTRSAPRRKPRPKHRAARKLVATKPAPVPEAVARPAPEPEVAAAPPPQPRPAVAAAPPAPAATSPAAEARAVPPVDLSRLRDDYRKSLHDAAERYKRYPRFARDNGWEGRVVVRVAIGADGAIASMRVTQGSGYALLDQEAQEIIRSAMPVTPIPAGLRGTAFAVDIPVIFRLRDDG